ncbi:MAG TPA: anti-sigma factor [Kineosporiaceae bacterium]|nr:anti-sigma factor [Kineosporiaceae bacterium]
MPHSDPDVLALVALGEPAPGPDAEHLRGCEQCRADVEELRQVVSAVRVDVPAGPAVAPPASVWEDIAAATGVRTAPRPDRMQTASAARTPPTPQTPQTPQTPPVPQVPQRRTPPPVQPSQTGQDELTARRRRRDRTSVRTLIAVAAALVIGAVGGVFGSRLVDRPDNVARPTPGATQQVLAQVPLSNLKPAVTRASGSAAVVRTPAGERLVLNVSQLKPQPGHFYDVWLIDPKIKKMVSLGILDGTTGEFVIPEGVDVSAYPIVDVSVQQPGDPKHSGDSVLRGVIKT